MLSRRLLLASIGLGALAAILSPLAARAQARVPRVGVLRIRPEPRFDEAFRQGLRDLGYVEGRNIALEYRWTQGKAADAAALAAELVRLKVDVIVAGGSEAILAAKNATRTIPIVMALSADPVRAGYVASLARPGGNVTGVSLMDEQFSSKWVELLKDALPDVSHVAVLGNPTNPATMLAFDDVRQATRKLGLKFFFVEARLSEEFENAFAAMAKERVGALVVLADGFFSAQRTRLVDLAAKTRLPAMYQHSDFVDTGGLMSYGPNLPVLFRRAATYVDKLLKGAKPGDLPVELPTKYDLVVNLKTARALGLTIPPMIVLRADRVIE